MIYTARATAVAPHGEHLGVEVHAMVDTGHGWADRGVVQRSQPQTWLRFDEHHADQLLAGLGWTRVGDWTTGGGTWFATVVRT